MRAPASIGGKAVLTPVASEAVHQATGIGLGGAEFAGGQDG